MASGIALAFLFGHSNIVHRIFTLGLLSLLFYGIYLTNSRGGVLALMATVFFYFIRRSRHFLLGGIIGGLFVFAIFSFGPSRLALLSISEDSAFSRIELWYEGIMMLKSNPLFGVGFNMFTEDLPQTAHNSFILAAAELGFVGLFFFMGLIYVSFRQLSIIQQQEPQLRNYAYALQSALIGFSVGGFFLSRTYVILPYMIFALSGSLFFIARGQNPSIEYKFDKKEIRNVVSLCFGILLLTYGIIKFAL
jgi:O-antigen ligase